MASGLWITDGTTAGTSLVADVSASAFTTLDGTVYFLGSSQNNSLGLWKTDGTAAGTVVVKDLPEASSIYSSTMTVAGNRLFFTTTDNSGTGDDLWESNGTTAGTTILQDFPDRRAIRISAPRSRT